MTGCKDPFRIYLESATRVVSESFERRGLGQVPPATEPPKSMGDIGFAFFDVAKRNKTNPAKLASELAFEAGNDAFLSWTSSGPYLNAHLPKSRYAKEVIESAIGLGPADSVSGEGFGTLESKGESRVVEHTSANPNGPLHVGRARNPIIGDTMARLLRAAGYKVETQFYVDDMGMQVATLAWGLSNIESVGLKSADRPRKDYQLVRHYQEASAMAEKNPEADAGIRNLLRLHESGDEEAGRKIRSACDEVLDGMKEGLARLNVSVDRFVWESEFVRDGSVRRVVERMDASSLSKTEDDGAKYLEMEGEGVEGRSTKFIYRRSDGTSLYAARDIAYHQWKISNYDGFLDILGEDHKLQAKQVAVGLREAGTPERPSDSVLFYSFVSLPEGKMSTRKDRVVYLDDLVDEAVDRARKEVEARRPELSTERKDEIADAVGRASVRYNIVKVQPEKKMTFKWDEALNFEGDSAPFIMYGNARCAGILGKAGDFKMKSEGEPCEQEWRLIKSIGALPGVVESASKGSPHQLAKHASEIVASFNQFYRDCPVLTAPADIRDFRLSLVKAASNSITGCLNLLGLPVLGEM